MSVAATSRTPCLGRSGAPSDSSGSSQPQARCVSGRGTPRLPSALARSYAEVTRIHPGSPLKPTQAGSSRAGSQASVPAGRGPNSEMQMAPGSGDCSEPREEERIRTQWKLLRERSYSLFIDRIPVGKDAKWLRALFSREGRVVDVFIPTRWRRGSSTRFGFVRFRSWVEAVGAVRRLNGLRVGNGRLEVKLADNGGKPRQESRGTGCATGNRASENVREWRPKQAESQAEGGRPAGNSDAPLKRSVISLDVIPENEVWLKLCVIGELKDHVSVEQLKEDLRNHDIGFYKVFPMAGQKMMINFSTQEEMDKVLSENIPIVLKRFSKIQQVQEDASPSSRLIWISVTGLPYKAWSESNYAKLAEPFGRYLRMDDRSKQFTGLDRARFLVETTLIGSIAKTIEAEIGGKVFQLGVFEDCFLSGCETEGLLRDESSDVQKNFYSTPRESNEISSKSQGNEERVAEAQSETAVGEGIRHAELSSGVIEITKEMVPEGGQIEGSGDNNMERPRNSKEGSRYEVVEIEEVIMSEDDSALSLEKIQNRLKVLRRKTAKDKEVVKYKRRMGRRCEKTKLADSSSLPRVQEAGVREEVQIRKKEGGIVRLPRCREAERPKERQNVEGMNKAIDPRREAELTLELAKSLGLEIVGSEEELIKTFMEMEARRDLNN